MYLQKNKNKKKMAATSASLLKTSPTKLDKSDWVKGQSLRQFSSVSVAKSNGASLSVKASYADELVKTAKTIASPGRGIL
ncbi:hypothetical protein PJI19_29355, partial [Mycobacterium kansasii]